MKLEPKSSLARLLSASSDQSRDTGLAMVLLCLLLVYFWGQTNFVPIAMVLLVLTMAWPNAFRPLAFFWFGLSHFMGNIVSKVILSILFFLVVTPIGPDPAAGRGRLVAVEKMEERRQLGI